MLQSDHSPPIRKERSVFYPVHLVSEFLKATFKPWMAWRQERYAQAEKDYAIAKGAVQQ
jgi:hypothetical protein